MVCIPNKLLNIVALNKPAESLTLRYLGERFFWKNIAINKIIGIGKIATTPKTGAT